MAPVVNKRLRTIYPTPPTGELEGLLRLLKQERDNHLGQMHVKRPGGYWETDIVKLAQLRGAIAAVEGSIADSKSS